MHLQQSASDQSHIVLKLICKKKREKKGEVNENGSDRKYNW